MNTYQVSFPLVTVAEETREDAIQRALETLARLIRSGNDVAFVWPVVALEPGKRLDLPLIDA